MQSGEMFIDTDGPIGGPRIDAAEANDRVSVVRAGSRFGYQVRFGPEDQRTRRGVARFDDDAGSHWELDVDMHLVRLDSRDW